jgi:hypothetical protein
MNYILKIETNQRFFYNKKRWFIELNLLPEELSGIGDNVISFEVLSGER